MTAVEAVEISFQLVVIFDGVLLYLLLMLFLQGILYSVEVGSFGIVA